MVSLNNQKSQIKIAWNSFAMFVSDRLQGCEVALIHLSHA